MRQADISNIGSAFLGGIVFNAANILFAAAIAIAGMAVAFPIGIGIALVLGVMINYIGEEKGDPLFIFLGVLFVVAAIFLNAKTYRRSSSEEKKVSTKGILLSMVAGLLMSFFYRFIAVSMDLNDFVHPAAGKMTPYTAVFIFSVGILISNFLFNTILMKKPFEGLPTGYSEYFK